MFAAAPLVLAINHLLAAAEWARLRLLPFAGQRLRLEIGPVRLGFVLMETGLFAADAAGEDAAAVHVTLPPDTPLLLLRDASLVMQQTQISGNVDFAETLNFVFRHLEWDAEADLAGLIGDMPARRLTLLGQALRQRLRQSGASLLVQMRAYAHDKTGLLPTPAYLAAFAREVGALRADLAALEQRLAQLERHR